MRRCDAGDLAVNYLQHDENKEITSVGNGLCDGGEGWVSRLTDERAEQIALTLKAVAHPVRLRILELLEPGERCVGDIVKALGAKSAITSQQLNMMRDRQVLACRRDGAKVFYRIVNPNVIQLLRCVYRCCEREG